jgi:hypothetical protein
MTPHAKYDTASSCDERFERSWWPSKGISIKNKCARIFIPHNYKNIEILRGYLTKYFALENRSYLGKFEEEFKKALARE